MESRFDGFSPSCRTIFMPSIKKSMISNAGRRMTNTMANRNRINKMKMIALCAARWSAYWARRKKENIARHIIIKKKEAPLCNVLGSMNMIPVNILSDIKKINNVICHMVDTCHFLFYILYIKLTKEKLKYIKIFLFKMTL